MAIQFACEGCGKAFSVKDEMAGKKGKCSACGAAMMIPRESGPVSLRPAETPRIRPAIEVVSSSPQPVPSPSPSSHVVNIAVMDRPERKGSGGFGIASFVLGLIALLICWIPLLNLASLPLLLIGGILSIVGILASTIGKRSGLAWPLTGGLLNLAAFGGFIVTTMAFAEALKKTGEGMKRAQEEANPIARPVAPARPAPVAIAPPVPAPPTVIMSGQLARLGDVEIYITRVAKGKTTILNKNPFPGDAGRGKSKEDLLSIYIRVANASPSRKIDYRSMGGSQFDLGSSSSLEDNFGNHYRGVQFGFSNIAEGQTESASIYPGKNIDDHLVFELPVDTIEYLTLEMPADRVGGTKGTFRFRIPADEIGSE